MRHGRPVYFKKSKTCLLFQSHHFTLQSWAAALWPTGPTGPTSPPVTRCARRELRDPTNATVGGFAQSRSFRLQVTHLRGKPHTRQGCPHGRCACGFQAQARKRVEVFCVEIGAKCGWIDVKWQLRVFSLVDSIWMELYISILTQQAVRIAG